MWRYDSSDLFMLAMFGFLFLTAVSRVLGPRYSPNQPRLCIRVESELLLNLQSNTIRIKHNTLIDTSQLLSSGLASGMNRVSDRR